MRSILAGKRSSLKAIALAGTSGPQDAYLPLPVTNNIYTSGNIYEEIDSYFKSAAILHI